MTLCNRIVRRLGQAIPASFLLLAALGQAQPDSPANRLAYLDGEDPFHVGLAFPRLTTPQWVG